MTSIETESATHYYQRSNFYNENRSILINEYENIDQSHSALSYTNLVNFLLM